MHISVGDLYEDCSYHPVRCEDVDGDDLAGVSLIDGSRPRCCSLTRCVVKKIDQERADELVAIYKKDGERGLMKEHGWTDDAIDNFMKNWR